MKPVFKIRMGETDLTDLFRDRLLSIRITDKPGMEHDECEITLDDRDDRLRLPRRGALLSVCLGYQSAELVEIGAYKVCEVEVKGPPSTLVLRCKAADLRDDCKSTRSGSWENSRLEKIVADIAERNDWIPKCTVDALVPRADQVGENDLHFITRLSRQYDATATLKEGFLLVLRRGAGERRSGTPLEILDIHRSDLADYSLRFSDQPIHSGVKTSWHNNQTGNLEIIELKNPAAPEDATAVHTDRHTYPNKAAAAAAAESRLAAFNRATATGRFTLEWGNARLCSEIKINLSGIKSEVDGQYLVESVEHRFDKSGWTTSFEINAGNEGKANAGSGKKKPGAGVIVALPDR
ncbi:MAG: contractile injection system protein, VgrG/Pvc8 family [Betaproteobacteria bacterium]|nr:contractile injection system protein, VgrG/Pvc8 family [Betaproteobacteria bacterium]